MEDVFILKGQSIQGTGIKDLRNWNDIEDNINFLLLKGTIARRSRESVTRWLVITD